VRHQPRNNNNNNNHSDTISTTTFKASSYSYTAKMTLNSHSKHYRSLTCILLCCSFTDLTNMN